MKMRCVGLSAVLLAATPLCLSAGDKPFAMPKDLPAYGTLKPTQPKNLKKLKLSNGMEAWIVSEPGFPKVALALAVHGGYAADPSDRPGLAELLAATVTEGTATENAKQLAESMQSVGGDLEASADADAVVVSTAVLANGFDKALTVLADVGRQATFPESEVKLAASNLISALQASEAEPSFLAKRALYRSLFADHPYATISATKESLAAATVAQLKSEYLRRFRPDEAIIVVVGDVSTEKAEGAIEKAFGSWKAPVSPPVAAVAPPSQSQTRAVVYVPRPGSVQTALYLGSLVPSPSAPDYYSAQLANAIYAGMFGSRLTTNIREDKGYTYSPGGRISGLGATGVLVTRADVRNEVTGPAFNEIEYEMNRMATTAPSEVEVTTAKRYMVGSLALQSQSRSSVALRLVGFWKHGQQPEELWKSSQKIESASPADIENAGKKYFGASHMNVVAVGDEKVIKDSLAPFGVEFKKAQ